MYLLKQLMFTDFTDSVQLMARVEIA